MGMKKTCKGLNYCFTILLINGPLQLWLSLMAVMTMGMAFGNQTQLLVSLSSLFQQKSHIQILQAHRKSNTVDSEKDGFATQSAPELPKLYIEI